VTRVSRQILIRAGDVSATATLNDSSLAQALWRSLPMSARANTWGDEIYFSIVLDQSGVGPTTDGVEVVSLGDIAFWPPGSAFCLFFGRTPASRGDEIRPASAVHLFGRIDGDPLVFRSVRSGANVTLEAVNAG
jgi:hypothetical protein